MHDIFFHNRHLARNDRLPVNYTLYLIGAELYLDLRYQAELGHVGIVRRDV